MPTGGQQARADNRGQERRTAAGSRGASPNETVKYELPTPFMNRTGAGQGQRYVLRSRDMGGPQVNGPAGHDEADGGQAIGEAMTAVLEGEGTDGGQGRGDVELADRKAEAAHGQGRGQQAPASPPLPAQGGQRRSPGKRLRPKMPARRS